MGFSGIESSRHGVPGELPPLHDRGDFHVPDESAINLPDHELLARTAAGDHRAFAAFVQRHQSAVFRYLAARTVSQADCEDALQEAFLAAFRSSDTYRGEASARAWVLGIARNVSRRIYRRRVGEPDHLVRLEELGVQAGWGAPPVSESFLEGLERRDTLQKAFSHLHPEDREILILRELEGLNGDETARLLDLSISAMKSRLHRARFRLAAVLKEEHHG